MEVSPEITDLFRQAEAHHRRQDVYNAVKLCKYIIRRAPGWYSPYALLGTIYKYQQDWKAALHYNKKAIALDASDQNAWWNVGIAATALRKPRLAQRVWNKFGLVGESVGMLKGVRIAVEEQFDLVWVQPLDPARGVIISIPLPQSGRRFQDVVLLDGPTAGYAIANGAKYPVHEELGVYKRSSYRTFSCQVAMLHPDDLSRLEKYCHAASLGFENWSNITRVFANPVGQRLPEYYNTNFLPVQTHFSTAHIAIAAPDRAEAEEVLNAWRIICLGQVGPLQLHL